MTALDVLWVGEGGRLGYLLHWRVLSDDVSMLLGAGVIGGTSTFSSFVYGSLVLMSQSLTAAVVASANVVMSLVRGYLAIIVGMKLGGQARSTIDAVAWSES